MTSDEIKTELKTLNERIDQLEKELEDGEQHETHVREHKANGALSLWWAECMMCEIGTKYHDNPEAAATTWNTRALTSEPSTAPLRSTVDDCGEDEWVLRAYYESEEDADAALNLLRRPKGVDWEAEAKHIAQMSYQSPCCEPYCNHWEDFIVKEISALASRAAEGSFEDGLKKIGQLRAGWLQKEHQALRDRNSSAATYFDGKETAAAEIMEILSPRITAPPENGEV
jgi:hypothetical protein